MRKLLLLSVAIIGSLILLSCGSTDSTTNYQVTISASPSEGGTVSPSSGQYEEGTSLDISATPSDEYRFVEWQGDYSGSSSSATITIDSDKNIKAKFAKKEYALTVNTEGEGTVDESVLQTTSTTGYESGTIVELTANPAEGWKFIEWQGDITSTENPTQITVDEAKEVTAVFEKKSFAVTVNVEGEGSVTISPEQDNYIFGTEIELSANPEQDWEFSEWSGDISETDNPLALTVNGAMTITAIFSNTTFAGGNGTEANPYQISTLEQLQAINDYPEAHFVQINDIDASATANWNNGKGFKPIGDEFIKFTGSYNGQEYKIINLTILSSSDYVGLFGFVTSAKIINVFLEKVNVNGTSSAVAGGVIGISEYSNISNCYTTGNVSGDDTVGGLIGLLNYGSELKNSGSSAEVSGRRAGGLIGLSRGDVTNSYATGSVVGSTSVGGLIGINSDGVVKKSYATGNVLAYNDEAGGLIGENYGKVINCYAIGNVEGEKNVGGFIGMNGHGMIKGSYAKGRVQGTKRVGGLVGLVEEQSSIKVSYATGQVSGNVDVGGVVGLNTGSINSSYWDTESTKQSKGTGRGSADGATGLKTSQMTGAAAKRNMSKLDFSNTWVTTDSYPILQWQKK